MNDQDRIPTLSPPPADKRCGNCAHWNKYAVKAKDLDGICYADEQPDPAVAVVSDGYVGDSWLATKATHCCARWAPRKEAKEGG